MAITRSPSIRRVAAVVIGLMIFSTAPCNAQLSSTFYDQTCPDALSTIRTSIRQAVSADRRMADSLIRLHFLDCFVQGCDGFDLQERRYSFDGGRIEILQELIENTKAKVEAICPRVVSCADILAMAARDSSFAVGGPSWTVKLGRRDYTSEEIRLLL